MATVENRLSRKELRRACFHYSRADSTNKFFCATIEQEDVNPKRRNCGKEAESFEHLVSAWV